MVRIPHDGIELDVIEAGTDRETVMFLHGAVGDARVWSRHVARLAARFRCVALSDRGHGESTPYGAASNPWSKLSMETLADDACAVFEAIAPGGAHLVGHSRGGTLASWIAARAPDRVRSLTLAASPPCGSEAFRAFFRRAAPPADELGRHTYTYLAQIPDDAWPGEALTANYHGPALVVEGADDPLYSPVHTMLWRATLRQAELARVPGAHAFPFDASDGERVFSHLLDAFLAKNAEPR
ncbi:MAG: alpha/beta fold hydrolase [Thermoplasmatota archaeon]